ncbi:MAG: zinc-dependent alcohol dehydrogenase family protein [Xanthomonadales bacterium]|nr:zinc-dependent alcohol dehydrogenase family protein [Xanthomonadales bacterium]
MKAMVLEAAGQPLKPHEVPRPSAAPGQLLVKVEACGVCRTDLHLLDNELPDIPYPVIPGHQVVGRVMDADGVTDRRVGVPWLGSTCGHCRFCDDERENLCDEAVFTGYTIDGGFAEYLVVDRQFAFPLDPDAPAESLAPLLCAGLIGYRSLRLAGSNIEKLGVFGFGAAGHLVTAAAIHLGQSVYAFTRPGDTATQAFARELGCTWAGDSTRDPGTELDAALIFAPAGELVPVALGRVRKGGRVVCGGIHMSDIPSFPYDILWGERQILSVANLTRRDGDEFLQLAQAAGIQPQVTLYPLDRANQALDDLRHGRFDGAAVLHMG